MPILSVQSSPSSSFLTRSYSSSRTFHTFSGEDDSQDDDMTSETGGVIPGGKPNKKKHYKDDPGIFRRFFRFLFHWCCRGKVQDEETARPLLSESPDEVSEDDSGSGSETIVSSDGHSPLATIENIPSERSTSLISVTPTLSPKVSPIFKHITSTQNDPMSSTDTPRTVVITKSKIHHPEKPISTLQLPVGSHLPTPQINLNVPSPPSAPSYPPSTIILPSSRKPALGSTFPSSPPKDKPGDPESRTKPKVKSMISPRDKTVRWVAAPKLVLQAGILKRSRGTYYGQSEGSSSSLSVFEQPRIGKDLNKMYTNDSEGLLKHEFGELKQLPVIKRTEEWVEMSRQMLIHGVSSTDEGFETHPGPSREFSDYLATSWRSSVDVSYDDSSSDIGRLAPIDTYFKRHPTNPDIPSSKQDANDDTLSEVSETTLEKQLAPQNKSQIHQVKMKLARDVTPPKQPSTLSSMFTNIQTFFSRNMRKPSYERVLALILIEITLPLVPFGLPQVYYTSCTLPRWALRSTWDFTPEYAQQRQAPPYPLPGEALYGCWCVLATKLRFSLFLPPLAVELLNPPLLSPSVPNMSILTTKLSTTRLTLLFHSHFCRGTPSPRWYHRAEGQPPFFVLTLRAYQPQYNSLVSKVVDHTYATPFSLIRRYNGHTPRTALIASIVTVRVFPVTSSMCVVKFLFSSKVTPRYLTIWILLKDFLPTFMVIEQLGKRSPQTLLKSIKERKIWSENFCGSDSMMKEPILDVETEDGQSEDIVSQSELTDAESLSSQVVKEHTTCNKKTSICSVEVDEPDSLSTRNEVETEEAESFLKLLDQVTRVPSLETVSLPLVEDSWQASGQRKISKSFDENYKNTIDKPKSSTSGQHLLMSADTFLTESRDETSVLTSELESVSSQKDDQVSPQIMSVLSLSEPFEYGANYHNVGSTIEDVTSLEEENSDTGGDQHSSETRIREIQCVANQGHHISQPSSLSNSPTPWPYLPSNTRTYTDFSLNSFENRQNTRRIRPLYNYNELAYQSHDAYSDLVDELKVQLQKRKTCDETSGLSKKTQNEVSKEEIKPEQAAMLHTSFKVTPPKIKYLDETSSDSSSENVSSHLNIHTGDDTQTTSGYKQASSHIQQQSSHTHSVVQKPLNSDKIFSQQRLDSINTLFKRASTSSQRLFQRPTVPILMTSMHETSSSLRSAFPVSSLDEPEYHHTHQTTDAFCIHHGQSLMQQSNMPTFQREQPFSQYYSNDPVVQDTENSRNDPHLQDMDRETSQTDPHFQDKDNDQYNPHLQGGDNLEERDDNILSSLHRGVTQRGQICDTLYGHINTTNENSELLVETSERPAELSCTMCHSAATSNISFLKDPSDSPHIRYSSKDSRVMFVVTPRQEYLSRRRGQTYSRSPRSPRILDSMVTSLSVVQEEEGEDSQESSH
uniref:Uncharacterized protein n=1 Tax=Timema poppense TaxID=170557 RepID=A0A7R9H3U7_TIMPO|nr:unnamed protein product [Timema poppensis]